MHFYKLSKFPLMVTWAVKRIFGHPETHPTHLQLMPDRMTVSIQEEDQGRHLFDGAGVSGRATHTQTVLHLRRQDWCKTEPHTKLILTVNFLQDPCASG